MKPGERVAGTDVCQRERGRVSRARVHDYVALLKLRVMLLVVFTGAVGLAVPEGTVSITTALITIACIAAGAGGCGALNMWYDADIDQLMSRTRKRPIPQGAVTPDEAFVIGSALSVTSVLALSVYVNALAATLLAITIAYYVVLYTMGLKRRTPQNIVIGGAAGALPPLIGCAAATGTLDLTSLSLFLIIFLWTPPHFWALAIARSADYTKAGVPMMPNVVGVKSTATQIVVYSLLVTLSSFAPWALGSAGALYAAAALVLNTILLWRSLMLWRAANAASDELPQTAMKLFGFSILYLFAIYAILLLGAH